MSTSAYMLGRKKYARPQGMLWSENAGTLVQHTIPGDPPKTVDMYVPIGYEINSDTGSETDTSLWNQFLILSDNGRSPIDFKPTRIEIRERMINGRMRSYHVADKMQITVSWDNLPSRAFWENPNFNSNGLPSNLDDRSMGLGKYPDTQYTTDGGAGGVELLDWYNNHQGSFWVFLAYDNYANFGKDNNAYGHMGQYNEIMEVFFANFSYTVTKRGNSTHDLWNVSITLEEA
jgi:hypothetical protein